MQLALSVNTLSFNAPLAAPAMRTQGVSMMDGEGLKAQAKAVRGSPAHMTLLFLIPGVGASCPFTFDDDSDGDDGP